MASTYGGADDGSTWDEDRIYACVCDSIWPAGLGNGEVQATSWYGVDCSLREYTLSHSVTQYDRDLLQSDAQAGTTH